MISISVIEGRQSSSFLGIRCNSKSLPSAREGLQNYILYHLLLSYLGPCGDEGWLEREFVSQKNFKMEAIYAAI